MQLAFNNAMTPIAVFGELWQGYTQTDGALLTTRRRFGASGPTRG